MCTEIVDTIASSGSFWPLSTETWSAVAAIFAAIAAVCAAIVSSMMGRAARNESKRQLVSDYRSDYEIRRNFWTALERGFELNRGKIGSSNDFIQDFNEWLECAPFPPDVDQIPWDFQSWLEKHQQDIENQTIFQFVWLLFRLRENDGDDYANIIYDNRSVLTAFWDSWSEVYGARFLVNRFKGKHDELKILSWLEIALAKGIRSKAQAKRGFYR